MMDCTYRLSLEELINRPTAELRIVGSDGTDDDQNDSGDDDQNDQDSNDESNEDDDSDDSDDDDKKSKSEDPRIKSLTEERDRHYKRRKDAEAERDELKKQIADLQKNGTDDEALRKQVSDLQAENEKLRTGMQSTRIENSFFSNTNFKWKSPEDAFKLLDLKSVEIDDGKVMGMDAAIQKLAKEKAWLLDEAEDDGKKRQRRNTGKPPAGSNGSDEKSAQAKKATFQSKYPGLRR